MTIRTKYITFDNGTIDTIVIFPEISQHRDIDLLDSKILGAGFIEMVNGSWKCYGESISLAVKSRPQDTIIANEQLPQLFKE